MASSPSPSRQTTPRWEPATADNFTFTGAIGERLTANLHHWLLTAPDANPAMLQIFRDRDRTPPRDLVPWAGEFAGKYLLSATQALRLTSSPDLHSHLQRFVADLRATQAESGYLGPFPTSEEMTGPGRWDLWGQYHVMLGLYAWYRATGDQAAFAACRRCADLFCRTFLDGDKRVVQAGSEEMNESSIHIFTLLYQETRETRYLEMARAIEQDWETPPSGDHVRAALAGKPFFQHPKPRWESLHGLQAIAELFWITGETHYRQAFETIWWSIVEGDRHNTGGFSSGEQATGNPYDRGAIETCCTIAWMALTLDHLRLTGESCAADELELSTWNAVLGAQHPSGRWWTYNTPMDGDRKASAHEIVFQARAGSPELNCCSVNAPRGLGILSDWAVMESAEGMALNYYGPCELTARTPSGQTVRLLQETTYPREGAIRLTLALDTPERFCLRLRIPQWSSQTTVRVEGVPCSPVSPGDYLALTETWHSGAMIEIELEMAPQIWVGERESAGRVSLYHGPLLLAYDPRFDRYDPTALPTLDLASLPEILPTDNLGFPRPLLLLRFPTTEGDTITLCDFATAGTTGTPYLSWLPANAPVPQPFTRAHPMRRQGAKNGF